MVKCVIHLNSIEKSPLENAMEKVEHYLKKAQTKKTDEKKEKTILHKHWHVLKSFLNHSTTFTRIYHVLL